MDSGCVISSIIVQARPEHLDRANATIAGLPGAEVHTVDPSGRLIVVLETADDGELSALIASIGALDGVLGVNLVYHHHDTEPSHAVHAATNRGE